MFISKKDIEYKKGYLIYDKEPVAIQAIWDIERLERMYQEAVFINRIPEPEEPVTVDDFKFESMFKPLRIDPPVTPTLDEHKDTMEAVMNECAQIQITEIGNDLFEEFKDLVEFSISDEVIVKPCDVRYDTLTIGNPLELDIHKISDIFSEIAVAEFSLREAGESMFGGCSNSKFSTLAENIKQLGFDSDGDF